MRKMIVTKNVLIVSAPLAVAVASTLASGAAEAAAIGNVQTTGSNIGFWAANPANCQVGPIADPGTVLGRTAIVQGTSAPCVAGTAPGPGGYIELGTPQNTVWSGGAQALTGDLTDGTIALTVKLESLTLADWTTEVAPGIRLVDKYISDAVAANCDAQTLEFLSPYLSQCFLTGQEADCLLLGASSDISPSPAEYASDPDIAFVNLDKGVLSVGLAGISNANHIGQIGPIGLSCPGSLATPVDPLRLSEVVKVSLSTDGGTTYGQPRYLYDFVPRASGMTIPLLQPLQPGWARWYDSVYETSTYASDLSDGVGLHSDEGRSFYLRSTVAGGPADYTTTFGPADFGWEPLAGDWGGDGIDSVMLYDPIGSTFSLRDSNTSGGLDFGFQFGPQYAGWLPIAGDWNNDSLDTIGLFDGATSTFYVRNSLSGGGADQTIQFGPGGAGWLPIAGDWDGDGDDTVGLYDGGNGAFYLKNDFNPGGADAAFLFGPTGLNWLPVVGDWDGDGTDTIGLYDEAGRTFYLRNDNDAGNADYVIPFGPAPTGEFLMPIAGKWK